METGGPYLPNIGVPMVGFFILYPFMASLLRLLRFKVRNDLGVAITVHQ
jgi:hypothetical protein